jgi:hypothetical protein
MLKRISLLLNTPFGYWKQWQGSPGIVRSRCAKYSGVILQRWGNMGKMRHITFACKIFLDHPQCSGPSLIWLAINKLYTKSKIKLGFSKTLDYFFVLRMIKIKRCKRKIERKTENIHKCNTRLNLDYFFPGNGTRKRGLLIVKLCIKFRLDSQAYKSTIVAKGSFFS